MKKLMTMLFLLLAVPGVFASCNEDKTVCATPGPEIHGPYVRQNPVFTNVDFIQTNTLVTRPFRILEPKSEFTTWLSLAEQTFMSRNQILGPVKIPPDFYMVRKVWDNNVFFYDFHGATIFPRFEGAEEINNG